MNLHTYVKKDHLFNYAIYTLMTILRTSNLIRGQNYGRRLKMPRRGENIRKRKDGRWEGRFIKGYDSNGKAQYGSVYGKTYSEVKRKQTEAFENGIYKKQVISNHTTYRELLYLWLENNRIKLKEPSYAKYYRLIESQIVPVIGNIPIQDVDVSYINRILYEKRNYGRIDGKGGLSPSYVRSIAFILQSAITYASQNDYCLALKGNILLPVKSKKQLDVLTTAEQSIIEQACFENTSDKKLAILFSLYTGIRIGEVCGLRWEDIDYDNKTIHIRHTIERIPNTDFAINDAKTKLVILEAKSVSSNRVIPIPSKLLALLSEKGSGFIVKGKVYEYADPRTLQYFFSNKLKECNVRRVNFHVLRHTFATRCIESGMDIKSLSEILGHASVNITLGTYVHSSLEHKRKQLETMTAICGQK